jgi:polyhydroxybutyrate depolymerase
VRANRCEPTPSVALLPDLDPSDGTRVRAERYDGAAPVVHYAILGGGHTWPGGTSFAEWLLQGLLGAESKDLDTTRSIWRFFSGVAPTG